MLLYYPFPGRGCLAPGGPSDATSCWSVWTSAETCPTSSELCLTCDRRLFETGVLRCLEVSKGNSSAVEKTEGASWSDELAPVCWANWLTVEDDELEVDDKLEVDDDDELEVEDDELGPVNTPLAKEPSKYIWQSCGIASSENPLQMMNKQIKTQPLVW